MLPLIPKHPIIPGESRLFCVSPEGLGCSLGSQLLDTLEFGLLMAWGLVGGAMWGDIIFVSLPNGASSFYSRVGDSQWVAASIVVRGPCWRDKATVMTTFIFQAPTISSPKCVYMLCFVFVHWCLLYSRLTHTLFPLNLALAPASLSLCTPTNTYTQGIPSALPSWCPSLPSAKLLSNVAWWCHRQDQDAIRSICHRGRPFILYYVAMMGLDRGPPNCWVRGTAGPQPGRGWGGWFGRLQN